MGADCFGAGGGFAMTPWRSVSTTTWNAIVLDSDGVGASWVAKERFFKTVAMLEKTPRIHEFIDIPFAQEEGSATQAWILQVGCPVTEQPHRSQ